MIEHDSGRYPDDGAPSMSTAADTGAVQLNAFNGAVDARRSPATPWTLHGSVEGQGSQGGGRRSYRSCFNVPINASHDVFLLQWPYLVPPDRVAPTPRTTSGHFRAAKDVGCPIDSPAYASTSRCPGCHGHLVGWSRTGASDRYVTGSAARRWSSC